MTWREIKEAVEAAGIKETDEIVAIECERRNGDKTLHKAKSGNMLMLAEHLDERRADAHGCAV